jgi:flagellar protein FlaG
MTANVSHLSAVPDPTYGSGSPPTPTSTPLPAAPDPGQPSAPDPADLRLVIEEDEKAGCFVYKTVDRRTGKVIQQLPREELVKLREADDYAAGAVIRRSV